MKTTRTLLLASCAFVFIVSCKTTTPSGPVANDHGTPTAVGTPIGTAATATIDAAGGTLLSPDGRLEIVIPAGALSTATLISIQPVTNNAPLGAGVGFSLTPHGQLFAQPVTLRFHYSDGDRTGTDIHALAVATQKDDRIWYAFKTATLDSAAGTVSVATTHFSAYSLYEEYSIEPTATSIHVKTTTTLSIMFTEEAPVDDDPDDDLAPLGTKRVSPDGALVNWSVNGITPGNAEEGTVSPASAATTTVYTAPESNKNMHPNPAAVTANISFANGSRLSLIGSVMVVDGPAAGGRISLAATIDGSRTRSIGVGGTDTKTEAGSAEFVYDLSPATLDDAAGTQNVNWDDAGFGGTANWVSLDVRTYLYVCDAVTNRQVTDKQTTTQTFASSGAGLQITGAGLTIRDDGTYTLNVGAARDIAAASTKTLREYSGYCVNQPADSSNSQSPIPFVQYFLPFVGGGGMKMTGTIDPSDPNHIKGSYHGTDPYTLFSFDTTVITLPIDYTLTWDLMLTK